MGKIVNDAVNVAGELGLSFVQSEKGKKVVGSALGVAGIGAGTVIETAGTIVGTMGATGAGSAIVSLGSTLTGAGCVAAQAAIEASASIPLVGPAIASGISSMSSIAFAVASNPVVLAVGAIAAAGYGTYKLIEKCC